MGVTAGRFPNLSRSCSTSAKFPTALGAGENFKERPRAFFLGGFQMDALGKKWELPSPLKVTSSLL